MTADDSNISSSSNRRTHSHTVPSRQTLSSQGHHKGFKNLITINSLASRHRGRQTRTSEDMTTAHTVHRRQAPSLVVPILHTDTPRRVHRPHLTPVLPPAPLSRLPSMDRREEAQAATLATLILQTSTTRLITLTRLRPKEPLASPVPHSCPTCHPAHPTRGADAQKPPPQCHQRTVLQARPFLTCRHNQ